MYELEEKIMTLAEQLRAEGRQEERLEVAGRMLEMGIDASLVVRLTGLPLDTIQLINEKEIIL